MGVAPEVWLVRPPSEIRSRPCRRLVDRIERHANVRQRVPRAEEATGQPLVMDALLVLVGLLRGPYREAVEAIRQSGGPLSIDMPTGLGNVDALRPKWTVALTVVKEGMTEANCGETILRDIGIPPEAWLRTGPWASSPFYARSPPRESAHATPASSSSAGDPMRVPLALAGLAALRSGAERATVLAPEPAATLVQLFNPNLVVRGIGRERFALEDVPSVRAFVGETNPDVICSGMGAGERPRRSRASGDRGNPAFDPARGRRGRTRGAPPEGRSPSRDRGHAESWRIRPCFRARSRGSQRAAR